MLNRLEVGADRVHVLVDGEAVSEHGNPAALLEEIKGRLAPGEQIFRERDRSSVRLVSPGRLQFRGGRTWRERPSLKQPGHVDVTLLNALKEAHAIAAAHGLSPHVSTPSERPRAPKYPYHRKLCRLVFLAPDIQAAIVEGRQPYDLTIGRLIDEPLPSGWSDQRLKFGFPARQ
jgi:hypothetical protein